MSNEDGGFVIFSGNKLWYSSKEGIEGKIKKTPVNRTPGKVRNSAKSKRVIEYQLFEDIKNIEKDPFWFSFFEDGAIGKFPRNFKYSNNTISYRNKNKTFEMPLPEDLVESASIIKLFLFENANIISPDDLTEKREAEERRIIQNMVSEVNSWSQIKNEKQQSILISLFVERLGEIYKLTLEERKAILQQIKLGTLSGYLNLTNIEVVDGQIHQIHGFDFDPTERKFVIDTEKCKNVKSIKRINQETINMSSDVTKATTVIENKKSLVKLWNRYILELNKKYK
jgi:hypothetical protein